MTNSRKFTPKEEEVIVRRYQAGETTKALALALGCHSTTISAVLKRHDAPTRIRISQRWRREIVRLAGVPLPLSEIARRVHLPAHTVSRILREEGQAPGGRFMSRVVNNWCPPLPATIACETPQWITECCLWCGKLVRRRKSTVHTEEWPRPVTFCSAECHRKMRAHHRSVGFDAPRPLILERLIAMTRNAHSRMELTRIARSIRARKTEVEEACRRAGWPE